MWERDGNFLLDRNGSNLIQLIVHPQLVDQGHYTCRVELSFPHTPGQLGPVSAGWLTVIGKPK